MENIMERLFQKLEKIQWYFIAGFAIFILATIIRTILDTEPYTLNY
jgi:hypothetical protein